MEVISTNISGTIRREEKFGRQFLIAPATLIVPGVLNGSQGALLYPESEVGRNVDAWNHTPLVYYHPTDNGENVSARSPEILDKYFIGYIFNATANGKLTAECWFDVNALRKVDPELYRKVESGKSVELSTGLFTRNDVAPKGATHNGREYQFIARDYRPDHVAILPDEQGACSIDDGCGVNVVNEKKSLLRRLGELLGLVDSTPAKVEAPAVNETPKIKPKPIPVKGTNMDRKKTIEWLATNCDCWKGDRETLNKFKDDKLTKLKANAELAGKYTLILNKLKGKPAVNAEGEEAAPGVPYTELAQLLGIDLDPSADPVAFTATLKGILEEIVGKLSGGAAEPPPVEEPAAAMEEDPEKKEEEEMMAAASRKKPLTDNEWLAKAPAGVQAAVKNAMAIEKRERHALIERLTANVVGDHAKATLIKRLNPKPLDELRELSALVPQTNVEAEMPYNYFGAAAPVPVSNHDEDDILVSPEWNWKEIAKGR